MSDEESSAAQVENNETNGQLSLQDLPVEIFLHICSFLDASTLVHGLGLVCKQFHQILSNDSLWKVRINHLFPKANYPVLPPEKNDELFWKLSCVAIEKQTAQWKNQDGMEKLSIGAVHDSTMDAILLMQGGTVCITGARDRSLVCWKLPVEENRRKEGACIAYAHNGWIWDLASMEDTVYSCSWDQSIKAWTLTNTGLVHSKTYEIVVSGALLCVGTCPELGLFATGSFCKTVLMYDRRSGDSPVMRYQTHSRAVIRLAMTSNFILSASEDRTVSVWDHRAGKTLKNVVISKKSFPMSLCVQQDVVYVGDSGANLHVLDPKKDFKLVKSYRTGHRKGISGVNLAPGCLITSSLDETVKIYSPTDPPRNLTTLQSSYGEIPSIDYMNEVLAISGTDGIEIWRPKTGIQWNSDNQPHWSETITLMSYM